MNNTPAFTEQELVTRIKAGDNAAFEAVFRSYYARMVVFAQGFIHDRDSAENIVQGVFVRLWEKRASADISSLKAYLFASVRNSSLNEIKRLGVIRNSESKFGLEEVDCDNERYDFLVERLFEAVEQLPAQRRKIFLMSRVDGKKYREIAELLQLSPKTVECQMGKALEFLRGKLMPFNRLVFLLLLFIGR
jgi:RNA polymerase sigma-70 factor (ECF subfamily)